MTTSGHFHTKPFMEAVEQIGQDKVLFSVDYPNGQMDAAGRWFDDLQIPNELKLQIGRGNADTLFHLAVETLPATAASGFAS